MWNEVLAGYINEHCGAHSSQLSWYTVADKLKKMKELPSMAAIKAFKRRRLEKETPKDTENINKYLDERNEAIMERAAEREAFAVATDALAATVTQDDDGDGVVEASEPIVPALNALAGDDESLDGMTGLTVAL